MSRQDGALPRARRWRRLGLAGLTVATVMSLQVLSGTSAGFTWPQPVEAASGSGAQSHPNRFDPRSGATTVKPSRLPTPSPAARTAAATAVTVSGPQVIDRPVAVPMQPALVALDPTRAVQFTSSDGVLEVDVPVGAVSAADVAAAAGGSLGLAIRQVLPSSGGIGGGSGVVSFGTWLLQVVDGTGKVATVGLRQPLGFVLHYGERGSALDVAHAVFVQNPALPSWVDLSTPVLPPPVTPVSGARTQTAPTSPTRTATPKAGAPKLAASGKATVLRPALDSSAGTLSASVTTSGPNTALSASSASPVSAVGRPDPYEPTLSAGGLAAGYPIELPSGPGGLTPKLELSYDSAATDDVGGAQAANGWVGQGFTLGLGSISWGEHQDSTCSGCTWESSWQLNDAFGTSAELVPPNLSVATGNDDTGHAVATSAVSWRTAPETHAKVISFTDPSPPSGVGTPTPQCFRVWLPSGLMEEFGCTQDSMQWYSNQGRAYVVAWWLDLVTDPRGNQVHVTYQQDTETGSGGAQYPRDEVPATVEYDSPGCHDSQHACTGASWQPQMRASFQATHAVAHANGSVCTSSGSTRCDDPADLSGSGGLAAPLVESTFVLNDLLVQARASGSAGWNTLRDYRFAYGEWNGGNPITDPFSGSQEGTAGALELQLLTEIGADGTTALPSTSFGYQFVQRWYEDSYQVPQPGTNCGPTWMHVNGCTLWSESWQNNSYFLSQVSNGQGLQQTFSWSNGRNNSHGVVGGGSNTPDPLYCDDPSRQTTWPCSMPDDQAWSRAVLSSRTQSLVRVSQAGQGGTQTTTPVNGTTSYTYQLTYPLNAPPCADCVAGAVWGNEDDNDINDFYNVRFMGYSSATVALPDSASELHRFYSTDGIGLYDKTQTPCNVHGHPCWGAPWWDPMDASHGHEYELDRYDTSARGGKLLERVQTSWRALCPPQGVTATPPSGTWGNWNGNLVTETDPGNPVMVCDVQQSGQDVGTFDGASGNPVPHQLSSQTYDSYGRVTSQSVANLSGLADSSGHSNPAATWTGGVSVGAASLVSGNSDPAMGFDGSTGTVGLNVAGIDTTSGHQVTVELWMSWNGGPACMMPFGFASGYDLFLCNGNFGFNTANSDVYGVSGKVSANTPIHVVAVFTNGSVSGNLLYLNGVQQTLSQLSGTPATRSVSAAANASGWAFNSTPYAWGGVLDEVAVYNGALSAARVSAHYTAGASYSSAVLADAPQAYYRLDEPAAGSSPNLVLHKPVYVQNDNVSTATTPPTGQYLVDYPASTETEDGAGNQYQCGRTSYDGLGYLGTPTRGLVTAGDRYTTCGGSPTGDIRTTSAYDVFGNPVASTDADANAGVSGHVGCLVGGTSYSACTTYDSVFDVFPTSSANALNQTSTSGYQAPSPATTALLDSSGHGNQGTWGGAVGFGAPSLLPGDPDTAMSFDGSTASGAPALPGIDTTSGHQVTVELWMKWSGTTTVGGSQMPFGFAGYDLDLVPGTGFGFNTGNGDLWGVPASAVPANTPLHVVAVFTNGALSSNKLYLNGIQQTLTQVLGTAHSASVTSTARIANWYGPNYPFAGTLDEVAVYNGALSSSRVSAHYTAGAGYKTVVLADAPLSYYRMDDDTGAASPTGGYGLWPLTETDANGQTTRVAYDALGRETSRTLPGESGAGVPAVLADSSGHALQASWSGGVSFAVPGLVGGDTDTAMGFDGVTGQAGLSLPGVDTTSGHQVTVEFWMQRSGSGGTTQMPFGFNGYDLDVASPAGFGFNTANGDLYGVPLSAVPANTPLHIVAVFTNGGVSSNKLYINGVQQTLTQLLGTPLTPSVTAAANVSGWPTNPNYYFGGTLDEVAVYNGALPAARVSAHYSAGAGYKAAVLADAPLAYYRLDDSAPGLSTQTTAYTVWCTGTSAQTPCVEVDQTQRLNATTTATSRAFYDGLGHLVETRSPAPGGQDAVRYSYYDQSQRLVFQSVPYLVSAYTGAPGSAAYSLPDSTQAGTTFAYDGLGRLLTSTDALSFTSTKAYSASCAPAGTGDGGCYEQTLSVDGNGHQAGVLVDALGRTAYEQRYTGNSGATYALYATAKYGYDYTGDLVRITHPDGATQTTFGYDMAGRKTSMSDPDLGAQTYSYDQDGSLTQSVDARGTSGTIFAGYDGLDRPIWRNTSNSPTGAYDTYGYDSTAGGSAGIGRLTGETFASGSLSGSYTYLYDGRGRQTTSTLTMGAPVAPAFVQPASGHTSNVTSLGATFGSNVTAGNRIVVVVGVWSAGSANASGVTDSAGNTYTKVAGQVAADGTEETIWTAPITAGGGTKPTVTATADASADIGVAAVEYSGLSKASGTAAVDRVQMASGTSSGGTVSSGATAATTAGNELAVGAYVDSGFGDTLSYGSGWVGRVNVSPASDMELAVEDQGATLGATPNAQVSTSAGSTWLMATAVFRSAAYTTQTGYDDAGNLLTQTYPDGQVVTNGYTAQGWLSSVATSQGSTTLASGLGYTGVGGAFGEVTAMHLGGGYDSSASYDLLDRASDLKTVRSSDSTVMFEQSRTFDAAGNVMAAQTAMPGATDSQSFCYDEQDRLVWASAQTATPPCGGSNTAGTLTAAQYTQSFSYDTMGRLATGPLGSYAYGSSAHVHAATSIGTGWTAAYDAAGNMTCRAPGQSSTCTGTPTGAQLAYNNEGELTGWQNAPTSPTTSAGYLYDGQGQRVAQQVTQSGTTTTTVYVGDVEEVATSGATTTTTAYYYAAGKRIGLSVNGVVSYLASDALGSATVTLSSSGSPTGAQLFAPYGSVRYSSGTMPTSYGFTGQRSDAASGLDYYGARYYDPLAGQFTSADSVVPGAGFDLWGLSRYSYVEGNPEARTDPTGHDGFDPGGGGADPYPIGIGPQPNPGPTPIVPCDCGSTSAYNPPPSPVVNRPPDTGDGKSAQRSKFVSPPSGPDIKFISATCAQVNGMSIGACSPTGWNLNPTPDYMQCVGMRMCEGWDPIDISGGSFNFSNGGGDPEMSADQAAEDESRTGRQPMTQDTIDRVANKYGIDTSGVTRFNLLKNRRGGYRGEVHPDGAIDLTRSAFDSEAELAKTLKEETYHLAQIADRGWPATAHELSDYETEARAHVDAWWSNHPLGGW